LSFRRLVLVWATATVVGCVAATPAAASVSTAAWQNRMLSWTHPAAASFRAWNDARLDRRHWRAYRLDWSTDLCTAAPDRPFGFDFRLACWRHDFGYRNYGSRGALAAHKERVDAAFYTDMLRVCSHQDPSRTLFCQQVARLYYLAVRLGGSSPAVDA
jgi:hypothetical protein